MEYSQSQDIQTEQQLHQQFSGGKEVFAPIQREEPEY